MALNVDKLKSGLEDYRRQLEIQRTQLRDSYEEVGHLFDALFAAYAGESAESFRQRWVHTSEWFETYLAGTRELDAVLEDKIDHLRHL